MWLRKDLKSEARFALKRNYWCTIAVCFIMAIIVGKYGLSTTLIHTYDENRELPDSYVVNSESIHNTGIVNSFLYGAFGGETNILLDNVPKSTKGALGTYFNNASQASSFLYGFLNSLNQFFFQDRIGAGIIIFIGSLLSILFLIFISNLLKIGECRFFLENRLYHKTKISRVLFLYKIRTVWNPAKIMLCRSVYLILWFLTIIGGIIKVYSYQMVPYILAENPLTPRKEAFKLSRTMMNGHKWRTFVLDLSFWYWYVLEFFTFGLVGLFFVNSYTAAVNTELYMALRKNAIEKQYQFSENFNDRYIEQTPAASELVNPAFAIKGQENLAQYPVELYHIPEVKTGKILTIDYQKKYTMLSFILLFFFFAFLGWSWEVGLNFFTKGHFVNRGFLYGPYLPIYGCGSVLMLLLLRKCLSKPVLTFFLIMVICAVVEYFTSYFLEIAYGIKWWDYSGYLLNINGRICLEGTIFFGIGGCLIIYVLAPLAQNVIEKINKKMQIVICVVLIAVFMVDFCHSLLEPNAGDGITNSQNSVTENWEP